MPDKGGSAAREVAVRRARPSDEEALTRYVCAVAKESEARDLDAKIVSGGVRASLASPANRRYYIAEREGVPVGCCLVTTEWSDWSATWYWWLQSIYVEGEARGTGVLEALTGFVQGEAATAGVRLVRLYVHAENTRARRAYARIGYHEVPYRVHERELPPRSRHDPS